MKSDNVAPATRKRQLFCVNSPWNSDKPYSYAGSWFGSRPTLRMINMRITGDPESHWWPYAIRTYMAPAIGSTPSGRSRTEYTCLLLGSNEGWMEQALCKAGFVGKIVASDIAENAMDRARRQIAELGYSNVEYVLADLNKDRFSGPFDYIVVEGVLHHIENLESCLNMLHAALSSDGYLIGVEFEGPFRFQLSEKQVEWINAVLGIVPRRFRPIPSDGRGDYPPSKAERLSLWYSPPTEDAIKAFDPSEALSGPALKALMPVKFKMEKKIGYGGPVLSYISQHFDFELANTDGSAARWLDLLIETERTLIDTGILEDEFFFYVARKRIAS